MFPIARPHARWNPRHPFRGSCQAVRLEPFELVGERILDLSTHGCLLACDAGVDVGEELLLSFRAPWLGPWIDVRAQVCRVVEGWRRGDPGYGAGLRFIDLGVAARAELEVRLEPFPLARARRRPPADYAETVRRIRFGAPRSIRRSKVTAEPRVRPRG